MNRCINIIEQLDREAEHQRRLDRVKRSEEVFNAALDEAIQNGITLSWNGSRYELADNRHVVRFYVLTNTVMRKRYGEEFGEWPANAEYDIHEIVLLFAEGAFLK